MPAQEQAARAFAEALGGVLGKWTKHRFPDGESLLRVETPVHGASAWVFGSLDRPDEKALELFFLAETLRDLGARRVFLAAPYLAYLRQDARFRPGEAVSSRYFAKLLSSCLDGIVTVDPHLHRIPKLGEIYPIPTRVVHAASAVARWIRDRIANPLVVGPDSESEQWVRAVAAEAKAPFMVLEKIRRGDRDVEIAGLAPVPRDRLTPVLIDDIISSGRTMIAAASLLRERGFGPAVGMGIHGIFAEGSMKEMIESGLAEIVTCNTIRHETNRIDLNEEIARAAAELGLGAADRA